MAKVHVQTSSVWLPHVPCCSAPGLNKALRTEALTQTTKQVIVTMGNTNMKCITTSKISSSNLRTGNSMYEQQIIYIQYVTN